MKIETPILTKGEFGVYNAGGRMWLCVAWVEDYYEEVPDRISLVISNQPGGHDYIIWHDHYSWGWNRDSMYLGMADALADFADQFPGRYPKRFYVTLYSHDAAGS